MTKLETAGAVLAAALSLAPAAFAQGPLLERTATSSIKVTQDQYGTLVTTTSRRFSVAELYAPTDPTEELLLLEEFRIERRSGLDGQKGVVRVEAWLGLQPPKKHWAIEQEGDVGQVYDDDFYRVTKYGCCASLTTDVYFNLRTGEKTFSATHRELFRVIVPNTGIARYVAYHGDNGSVRPIADEKRDDLIGVIQYGSREKVMLRLAVRSKRNTFGQSIKFSYRNKITEEGDLMLWGVDGKKDKSSLSDFSIIISHYQAGDIVLPVRNDEIDLGRATVPPGLTLEVLK